MVQQARDNKLGSMSPDRFEQIVLAGTILIWIGVAFFGAGLFVAFKNLKMQQSYLEEATAIALAATATETATPSPTPLLFPAGWSTATPTMTPISTPTLSPTAVPIPDENQDPTPAVLDQSRAFGPDPSWDEGPSFLVVTPPTPTAVSLMATPPARRASPTPTPDGFPGPAAQPPDRVVIQSIKMDTPVVPVGWHVVEQGGQQYSVWDVAKYAASWHKTSAYPGHNGNVVLSGHNNILGEVFRYLIDVEVGARVLVYAGDLVYHYQVTEKHLLKEKGELPEIRRENAKWIAPTESERLTMVTCWPYTGNSHRLVVVAEPVSVPISQELHE